MLVSLEVYYPGTRRREAGIGMLSCAGAARMFCGRVGSPLTTKLAIMNRDNGVDQEVEEVGETR